VPWWILHREMWYSTPRLMCTQKAIDSHACFLVMLDICVSCWFYLSVVTIQHFPSLVCTWALWAWILMCGVGCVQCTLTSHTHTPNKKWSATSEYGSEALHWH
jgi:hypothetical protein